MRLETVKWRGSGTCILHAVDGVQTLLEEQTTKTQAMRGSPYVGPFEERVKLWDARLNLAQVRHGGSACGPSPRTWTFWKSHDGGMRRKTNGHA
jgi:Dynein heavy chain, N-terminal region 2